MCQGVCLTLPPSYPLGIHLRKRNAWGKIFTVITQHENERHVMERNPYADTSYPGAKKPWWKRKLVIIPAASAVLFVAGMAACSTGGDEEGNGMRGGKKVGDKYVAQTQCEQQMKERSSDPEHVEFSGQFDNSYTETDFGWIILGTVDNPNGFGGFTHHDYRCTVEKVDDSDQVSVSLDISDPK